MIAFNDFEGAKASFLKAMKFSLDAVLMNNFNALLSSFKSENGNNGDVYDEFRKAQNTCLEE